jgi:hypothetical protein
MSNYIEASFDTLFNQASDSASDYLSRARRHIDNEFGEGYAAKNPNLVAAFMQVSAADFAAATHAKVYGTAFQEISQSISSIADAIERDNS